MKIKKNVVTPTTKKSAKPVVNAKQVSASTSAVATSKAKTPVTPVAVQATASINKGKTTGMRVMAFQDLTLKRNDEPKYRLTDTELAALWRAEFPQSRAVLAGRIDESIVRGVRNLFNQGTGGHGTSGSTNASKPYVLDNGKRVVSEYTRARKPEAEAVEAPALVAPKAAGKGKAKAAQAAQAVVEAPVKKLARGRVVGRPAKAA
jgi:hypothetical protein